MTDYSPLSNAEKENKRMLVKDIEAYMTLWSKIISEAIELHLSIFANDKFITLLPIYLQAIETLVIYYNNNKLRASLSSWMKQIAMIMIVGMH